MNKDNKDIDCAMVRCGFVSFGAVRLALVRFAKVWLKKENSEYGDGNGGK